MSSTTDLFDTTVASSVLSQCGQYRYELRRNWATGPVCGWIMLNPSTADAHADDPTVRRCVRFARRWGYAGIVVRNLYALRATDPRILRTHPCPVGADNDSHLLASLADEITVCAWGAHGRRGAAVRHALAAAGARLHYLALTRPGMPRHPLYLPADLDPIPYTEDTPPCVYA